MCVLYTEEIGGILTLEFDDNGSLQFKTEALDADAMYDEMETVTKKFVEELISIVKEIHQTGLLTEKYGKEIPIIIHELEYYDEIAEQNIEANGLDGLEDFIEFCRG